MLKPTPPTAFGLRPSSGIRISDFSCLPAAPRQPRAPVNGATTACQRCCYGAALYWCSIVPLLFLYWSSIGPLLVLYCSSTDGGFLPPTRPQRPGRRRCPGTSPTGSPTRSPAATPG